MGIMGAFSNHIFIKANGNFNQFNDQSSSFSASFLSCFVQQQLVQI